MGPSLRWRSGVCQYSPPKMDYISYGYCNDYHMKKHWLISFPSPHCYRLACFLTALNILLMIKWEWECKLTAMKMLAL